MNTKNNTIYFKFEDVNVLKNCKEIFQNNYTNKDTIKFIFLTNNEEYLKGCLNSAELTSKGWEKEAIPIIQTKKSAISRIFSAIFN